MADKGGRGVGKMLIMADKGGRGGLYPPFLADIICEQSLIKKKSLYIVFSIFKLKYFDIFFG